MLLLLTLTSNGVQQAVGLRFLYRHWDSNDVCR